MGCKYSCSCAGMCGNCSEYSPEEYLGHAEDVLAQAKGYKDADDMVEQNDKLTHRR